MQIPKLTNKQLMYAIIIVLLFVVLIFTVRDYQSQNYINYQQAKGNDNLEWLAGRCGCDLKVEIENEIKERQAMENYDINFLIN